MKKYLAYIFIIGGTGFAGCFEGSECSSINTNLIKVTFFNKTSREESTRSFTEVRAVNNTELIYGANSTLSTFMLPLDPSTEQSTFIFKQDTLQDTLMVNYTARSYLKRLNCDTELEFSDLSITQSTFDSTVLKNKKISTEVETNVKIYN